MSNVPASHNISISVGDKVLERWQNYSIENDMLSPADAFSMTIAPATKEFFELVPPDTEIGVRVDGTTILTGFVDERRREVSRGGSLLQISGRDRAGRMVDESADLFTFPRLSIQQLAERLTLPTFPEVRLSNAENRDLIRGKRSGKAPARSEPIISKRSAAPKKVEPGQKRWEVLEEFLEPANLLAWSTGDGQALVVGLPNYDQETQFRFFMAKEGSSNTNRSNVKELSIIDSVEQRYSTVTVSGSSRGDATNYGRRVLKLKATVNQGPNPDGTGDVFNTRKQLLLADDDVKSVDDAEERAIRELALRDATGRTIELTTFGHSQRLHRGDVPAIFGPDMMAEFEDEETGIRGRYLITRCTYTVDRGGGEVTRITMVPEGTVLTT